MQNLFNYGATLAEAEQHLAAFEPFHTGTLSGEWHTIGEPLLPSPCSVYTVYSYGVAIATRIVGSKMWVHKTAYDHSKTTSKHANLVKKAWGI